MKKILLIAYKFPPYSGVGGYRWSKLCKYLARLDYVIHVVTIDWALSGPNTLMEDVQHPNIIIHRLPVSLVNVFRYWVPRNWLLGKIKARIFRHIINPLLFFDDEAQHWGGQLIPYCVKLIKDENIPTLIATGAPFSSNRFAVEIKKACAAVKLIQDFRDPWLTEPSKNYSSRQNALVQQWQGNAIEAADAVVSVSHSLLDVFVRGTKQKNANVICNGYDPSMRPAIEKISSQKAERSTFVYIGNLYNGRDFPLSLFLEAIEIILPRFSYIKIRIAGGSIPTSILRRFADLFSISVVEYRGTLSQADALALVKNSDFALHVNSKETPFAMSTKIYEYAMLQIPTVSINYGGEVDTFIQETNIGYSLNAESSNLSEELTKILKSTDKEFSFNIADRSYEYLAHKYSEIIG